MQPQRGDLGLRHSRLVMRNEYPGTEPPSMIMYTSVASCVESYQICWTVVAILEFPDEACVNFKAIAYATYVADRSLSWWWGRDHRVQVTTRRSRRGNGEAGTGRRELVAGNW